MAAYSIVSLELLLVPMPEILHLHALSRKGQSNGHLMGRCENTTLGWPDPTRLSL